jgi:diguanylate cyclase
MHMMWDGHEMVVEIEDFVAAVDDAIAGDAVAVIVTDIDNFAAINDEFGHDVGDEVLEVWKSTVLGSFPPNAVIGRLGGDEYAVALPATSAESALILMEEVRQHLVDHPLAVIGRGIEITAGVAARPPHATDTADVVRCANAALMRGKREGRGRVVLYVEEKMVMKSNYYPRADLDRLARLASATRRTEASLLREALDDLLQKHREVL